jgi:hypothetical protein
VSRYRDHAGAAGQRERDVAASAALGRRASGSGAPKRRDSSTANCRPTDTLRKQAAELVGQPLPALAIGHAEYRPQDHLERHALHVRMHGERLALRPRHDVNARRRRGPSTRTRACARRETAANMSPWRAKWSRHSSSNSER